MAMMMMMMTMMMTMMMIRKSAPRAGLISDI